MLWSSFIVDQNLDFLMLETHLYTYHNHAQEQKQKKENNKSKPNIKLNHNIHVILCNCEKIVLRLLSINNRMVFA